MRSPLGVIIAAGTLLCGAPASWAQSSSPVTVTPYISFGTDGASPVGMFVTVPLGAGVSAESELAYRRGEGDVHAMSSSFSLLKDLPAFGRVTPYVAVGVGAVQFGEPVFGASGSPVGTARQLGLTVNAGGGIRVPVNSSMQFRTDVRYSNRLGKNGEEFRIANGISFGAGRKSK